MEKRSKAETETFYRGLLDEQAGSGVSLRAFAAARGIPSGTLSSWRHQLKRRDAEARASSTERAATGPRFVPVSVVGSGPGAATDPTAQEPTRTGSPMCARAGYEVVLGRDRLLRLPADFDAARVAALVRAVASC